MEEIGRTKPRTVSELMEVANRFADEEDAYNNKRGRSPEVDKVSRQRRRYRNGDSRVMTHKYRGSQQSSREVKPKFIGSTQGEPKNICKP
jgi:hypothetical protein